MAADPVIRRLQGPDDIPLFRQIRREALETHPDAFASTLQDLDAMTDAQVLARFESPGFVALDAKDPIGLIGYIRERPSKMAHRATLVMVFVTPLRRRSGLGRALLEHVFGAARAEGINQIELAVAETNPTAVAFYTRMGFETIGTIPRGFCHEGRYLDERLMVRRLDA
jgi:GNAT superfamily N-acetyltransferase